MVNKVDHNHNYWPILSKFFNYKPCYT